MRRFSVLIACAAACAFPATASAAPVPVAGSATQPSIPVSSSNIPAARQRLSERQVVEIANALPKLRALRAERPGYRLVVETGPDLEVVNYVRGRLAFAVVEIDPYSGGVLRQWTGFQAQYTMARGIPQVEFGGNVNALYIWLPLCVLFILPYLDWRRPFSLLHLDLLVLLSFSVSLAFFNHAHIYASVPLVYPPLLYLVARMLALLRRVRQDAGWRPPPLRLLVATPWLAVGVVLLLCLRIGLNVTSSTVIDVGQASVIGAERIGEDKPLYGPLVVASNEHGDTYGPASYEAYVPFEQIFGPSGTYAAHAAAIFFDLLATALLFLLGRRIRGPTLGVALAYAWVSYPFTLFALESNSNDSLLAALVLAAVLAASYRSQLALAARGGLAALAGLTKFAPLAIAPLLATHGLSELSPGRRARALTLFAGAFLGTAALVFIPVLSHNSLHTFYERTIVYQADRGAPFSVWGLYGGLGDLQLTVQIAAVLLALALAVVPRRPDLVGLAAACAAVLIATQLGVSYWTYFYIPWFFPLVMIALLGRLSALGAPQTAEASTSPGGSADSAARAGRV